MFSLKSMTQLEDLTVVTPDKTNRTMTRLDQGHLHPKLEVPGLTCPGPESNLGLHGGRPAL
jgi:hypothetical protein